MCFLRNSFWTKNANFSFQFKFSNENFVYVNPIKNNHLQDRPLYSILPRVATTHATWIHHCCVCRFRMTPTAGLNERYIRVNKLTVSITSESATARFMQYGGAKRLHLGNRWVYTIVPDFSISVYGCSCNSLFSGLILPFKTHPKPKPNITSSNHIKFNPVLYRHQIPLTLIVKSLWMIYNIHTLCCISDRKCRA